MSEDKLDLILKIIENNNERITGIENYLNRGSFIVNLSAPKGFCPVCGQELKKK